MSDRLDEIYDELVSTGKVTAPKGDYEFEVDLIGNLLSASPDAIRVSEYTREMIENMSVWDVVIEEDHELVQNKLTARKEGKEIEPYEVTLLTKSRKRIRIRIQTMPVIENGSISKIKGRFIVLD